MTIGELGDLERDLTKFLRYTDEQDAISITKASTLSLAVKLEQQHEYNAVTIRTVIAMVHSTALKLLEQNKTI